MDKSRGFVTLATGDLRYYKLAANLLASYRKQTENPLPFAIIAEEINEYTELFDDTVIMNHPERSFMDKIRLPEYVPYDDNIFIDADCLVYKEINDLFDHFDNIGCFSAIGETLSLDSEDGWFKKEDVGQYTERISYIAHLHGGMYFVRNNTVELVAFQQTCREIIENYQNFRFRMFAEPADEPVFALAMSIHNLPMIPYKPEIMCFYPSTTTFKSDIRKQRAVFTVPWNKNIIEGNIVHWSNYYTDRAIYIREIDRLYSDSFEEDAKIDRKYRSMKRREDLKDKLQTIKTKAGKRL